MNRKKLLAQQSQFIALANMHVDELAYRLDVYHPESTASGYYGIVHAHLAQHDHLLQQLSQLTDSEH